MSSHVWNDFIPAATTAKEKDNILSEHIMNFHIHPVDSYMDEPESRQKLADTSNKSEPKLGFALRGKPWRRNSEGSLFQTDKTNKKSQFSQNVLQPSLLNELWFQSFKEDSDSLFSDYSSRYPDENRERASSRSRARITDRKAMERLNISPVRNKSDQRQIPKRFMPLRRCSVSLSTKENLSPVKGSTTLLNNLSRIDSCEYTDLADIGDIRSYDNWLRDSRSSGNSQGLSNSQSSSQSSNRSENGVSYVTVSADAVLRKIKCSPEVLCEPQTIATQQLKNCLITYIPEDGSRFVTYISEDLLQDDTQNSNLSKQILFKGNNMFETDHIFRVDAPPSNANKKIQETKPKEIELYLNFPNQNHPSQKYSKKDTVLCRRVPIASLTSRAIPIDSPDLQPAYQSPSSQKSSTQAKNKYSRRKDTARQFSACSSVPSFPDSTILAQFQPNVSSRENLKFSRIWTNHQKSFVSDPVVDFRKEVRNVMQTSQGYLKTRLVQTPGKHPKLVACRVSDGGSVSNVGLRRLDDYGRSRRNIAAPTKQIRGKKNYAVVLPNVHLIPAQESAPIYVMSSTALPWRDFSYEVDA